MNSLEDQLVREVQKRGNDSYMAQQLRNQIMTKKRNQSTRDVYTSGITANHSPKADARFMANQSTGKTTDD